jgi:septal ring factor EnvC (AmiA/AmiB activator)
MVGNSPSVWPPRLRRAVWALAALACVLSVASAQDPRKSEAALKAVRKEIKDVEARLARETSRRDARADELRGAELEIAAATRDLADIRSKLTEQRAAQRALAQQTDRANQRLANERAALAQQVRMSYVAGREELFKLLLSQESPATLGRMLVYYDYYNRARTVRIMAVGDDLDRLAGLRADTERGEAQLAALEAAQVQEVARLAKSRDERQALLARVEATIKDDSAAVGKLRGEEKRLSELIEQLQKVMAGVTVEGDKPFATVKGKLGWPVQGRLIGEFGQPRDGPCGGTGCCWRRPRARRCVRCTTGAWPTRIGCQGSVCS